MPASEPQDGISRSRFRALLAERRAVERAHRAVERAHRASARTAETFATAEAAAAPQSVPSPWARAFPRHVLVLPGWVDESRPSHRLIWVGGVLGCRDCAAMSTGATANGLLRAECRKLFPPGSRSGLKRLEQGLLPQQWLSWPDERSSPQDTRLVFPLAWCSALQRFDVVLRRTELV